MKLSITIIANNTTNTSIIVPDDNTITVDGETTDLTPIPNNGQADGEDSVFGTVTKDGAGVNTLTVLMQYKSSNTKWNGQELQELDITDFIWRDAEGAPILDGEGQQQALRLGIMDFIVPVVVEPTT